VQVAEGQTLDKVDFALPRMSTIGGRITDESGEPIEGVRVFSMRQMFFEGKRKLVPVGSRLRRGRRVERPRYLDALMRDSARLTLAEAGAETVALKLVIPKQ
jgi:hypothetical protein